MLYWAWRLGLNVTMASVWAPGAPKGKEMESKELLSLGLEELRDGIMDELALHFSRGDLSMEEYDRRCSLAVDAKARSQIVSLIDDLPQLKEKERAPLSSTSTKQVAGYRINTGNVPVMDPIINIFSGSDRKGQFAASREMSVLNIFGGSDIDLRQASLPPEGLSIRVLSIFGGCDIKLPPGLRLDARGIGVFGGFSKKYEEGTDGDAPLIRVRGLSVFGGCDVKEH